MPRRRKTPKEFEEQDNYQQSQGAVHNVPDAAPPISQPLRNHDPRYQRKDMAMEGGTPAPQSSRNHQIGYERKEMGSENMGGVRGRSNTDHPNNLPNRQQQHNPSFHTTGRQHHHPPPPPPANHAATRPQQQHPSPSKYSGSRGQHQHQHSQRHPQRDIDPEVPLYNRVREAAGQGQGMGALAGQLGSLEIGHGTPADAAPPCGFPTVEEPAPHPPTSSKTLRFPLRPGQGVAGTKCIVKANHFFAELPDKDLHHYDVAISPEVTSRGVNRAVMEQLVKVHRYSSLGSRLPVYDGRKSLYTAGPLPFHFKEFQISLPDEEDGSTTTRRERQFKVVIKFAARADLHHLGQFLAGKQADAPQEALQVLDIVLRELPTHRYSPVGRSFYSPQLGRRQQLGDGLESWRGFYQSIRPTQMGLSLNIDMSSTAFIEPLPVTEFVAKLLNKDLSRPLSDADRIKIKKALRGVKVEVTHRGNMRRKYRISGLTSQPTQELMFPVDDRGTLKSVIEYFRDTYGYVIRGQSLPCLQVGNQERPNYLPMEVCKIVEGQRYTKRLSEKQVTALLKLTCQRPKDREYDILQVYK